MKDSSNSRDFIYRSKNRHGKLNESYLQYLIKQVEKGTGLSIYELKKRYTQAKLFRVCLYHVTTTKKAISTAFDLPIENMCRIKRELEKEGILMQSIKDEVCPYTRHHARLLSTNPAEFQKLAEINIQQKKR